ncbi:MAG: Do family serine endopeptidase [Hyphomonadaceae bacterium]
MVRMGRKAARAGLIAAGLALAAPAFVAPAFAQNNKPIKVTPPAGAPITFADLIDRVSPAVVSVQVTTEIKAAARAGVFDQFRGLPGFDEYEDEFGEGEDSEPQDREGSALGSGFFIKGDGYIVTNHHVVENAREVIVSLKDGTQLEAEIIGSDEQTDLAVLKVKKAGSYPFVQFATKAKPRVGDWVVAVGNPFGLGGTATAGIVSADGREFNSGNYNDFIQIDAAINRGNSGGPTFNLDGEVIGVNTMIFSDTGGGSVGIGFAIEANAAKTISDTLIRDGKVVRGWLGVEIQSLDTRLADAWGLKHKSGAIVRSVTEGGPAESSGIKRGDVIISVNGDDVKDTRQLTQRVGSLLAGSENTFRIIRDGKEQTVRVTVRARDERALAANEPDPARAGMKPPRPSPEDVTVDGGTIRQLTPEESAKFDVGTAGSGLIVVTVEPRGALAHANIFPGDAILEINMKAVITPKDYQDAIAAALAQGKKDVVARVGCGNQARCGDLTVLRPIEIAPAG